MVSVPDEGRVDRDNIAPKLHEKCGPEICSILYILFFIDIAGITSHPDNRWMRRIARNVTDIEDGFLRDTRYLPPQLHFDTDCT